MSHTIPDSIGAYHLLSRLGQGGMGEVFLARHQTTQKLVALKTVRQLKEHALQSIRHEINVLKGLEHQGIVRLLDYGSEAGVPWYAMTLLKGRALNAHIHDQRIAYGVPKGISSPTQPTVKHLKPERSPPPSWTEALGVLSSFPSIEEVARSELDLESLIAERTELKDGLERSSPNTPEQPADLAQYSMSDAIWQMLGWVGQICHTLAYLHGEGLVHCDIKPENIIITEDGRAVVVDFGLASTFGTRVDSDLLDTTGLMAGTTQYISPEQIEGQWVDARADLYAIGCILYEVVTGRIPFDAPQNKHIYQQHLWKQATAPLAFNPEAPEALNRTILQLLAKQPRDRPGHAHVILAMLDQIGVQVDSNTQSGTYLRPYLYKPALIGRADQMRELLDSARKACDGAGRLVLLNGESGIGKTRLAMELIARIRSWKVTVVSSQCVAPTNVTHGEELKVRGAPLHAFRSLLMAVADRCRQDGIGATDRILGSRGQLLVPYARFLNELPGQEHYSPAPLLPAATARLRLFRTLGMTLDAWIGEEPLVLIFDDLQWADELSLACIRSLHSRLVPNRRWLLLGLYRSEEAIQALLDLQSEPGVESHAIPRLSATGVEGIIRDMLGLHTVQSALRTTVVRRSEGNPFYVAEYLRVAIEQGVLVRDEAGRWQTAEPVSAPNTKTVDLSRLPEPASIQELIASRLDSLEPDCLLVCEAAAIAGRETQIGLLRTLTGQLGASLLDAIDTLRQKQILEGGNPAIIRFTHERLREAAYHRVPEKRRIELHRVVGEALFKEIDLAKTTPVAALAYHWEKGDSPDKARRAYLQAARNAARKYAHADAERLFHKGLSFTDNTANPEILLGYLDLVEGVLLAQGRSEEARDTLTAALEEADQLGDLRAQARATLLMSRALDMLGHLKEAQTSLHQALNLFQNLSDLRGQGVCLDNLGQLYAHQGQLHRAKRLHDRASDLLTDADDHQGADRALGNLASIYHKLGNHDDALTLFEQLLDTFKKRKDLRCEGQTLVHIASIHRAQGRHDSARRDFELALEAFQTIGDREDEIEALLKLSSLHTACGRYTDAQIACEQASALQEGGRHRGHSSAILTHQGRIYILQGKYDEAIDRLLKALNISQSLGDLRGENLALGYLAEVHWLKKMLDEARRLLNRILPSQRTTGDLQGEGYTHYRLSLVMRDQGLFKEALQPLSQSIAIASELQDYRLLARARLVKASIHRYQNAHDHAVNTLNLARDLMHQSGDVLGLLLLYAEDGALALVRGQDALPALRQARILLESLDLNASSIGSQVLTRLVQAVDHHQNDRPLLAGEVPTALAAPLREKLEQPKDAASNP